MATTTALRSLDADDRENLTEMLSHFLMCTEWADTPDEDLFNPRSSRNRAISGMGVRLSVPESLASYKQNVEDLRTKRALARRLGAESPQHFRPRAAATTTA